MWPYVVVADIHAHKWSTFSKVDADGVNSRLRITLNELERAAQAVLDAGGLYLVIAGDIFHVRGSIDPEVLNPVQATIKKILDLGITIIMIPGNHDLASKDTSELSSAVQTLAQTYSHSGSVMVVNKPAVPVANMAFVPWCSDKEKLLAAIETFGPELRATCDLFIHAGIDGVLPSMPDHGLSAGELADLGFKRVFAGHYHNHKDLGGGVYSIGATTHQTWSDVDSKAGFLIVRGDKVEFNDSHAPKFIDVSGMAEDDIVLLCPGNYIRYRGSEMSIEQIAELRKFFIDNGALGVSIQAPRTAVTARPASAGKSSSVTLEASVAHFIDQAKDIPAHVDKTQLQKECAEILFTSRTLFEEA